MEEITFCIKIKFSKKGLIASYIHSWESPCDLPLVIEIFVSCSFRKRHKILDTCGRSPSISKECMQEAINNFLNKKILSSI